MLPKFSEEAQKTLYKLINNNTAEDTKTDTKEQKEESNDPNKPKEESPTKVEFKFVPKILDQSQVLDPDAMQSVLLYANNKYNINNAI